MACGVLANLRNTRNSGYQCSYECIPASMAVICSSFEITAYADTGVTFKLSPLIGGVNG